MYKKIFCMLIIIMLLFTFLSCGNKNNEINDNNGINLGDKYNDIDMYNSDMVNTTANFEINKSVPEDKTLFTPNNIIGNNMVLQRNAVGCLWGTTSFDGNFAVEIGNNIFYGTASANQFKLYIGNMPAGGPYDMVFYSKNGKYTVKNVMIGEVLLFSGQSNMEYTMNNVITNGKQFLKEGTYVPAAGIDDETINSYYGDYNLTESYKNIAKSEIEINSYIRIFNMRYNYTDSQVGINHEPASTVNCTWKEADILSLGDTSMFAYYFCKNLQEYSDIAIGCVIADWGGTNIPAWTPRETFEANYYGNSEGNENAYCYGTSDDSNFLPNNISRCYNTFIAPVLNFKFKAVIWYQGETQYNSYALSLTLMINSWREKMDNPDMGFLIVGLPRFGYGSTYTAGISASLYKEMDKETGMFERVYYLCREQQKMVAETVSNCTMSVNINTGDYDDIHPADKTVIARQTYAKFVEYFYEPSKTLSGPVPVFSEISGNGAQIEFSNIGSGLVVANNGRGFEISENGVDFYQVKAEKISDNNIFIENTTDEVVNIKYIRYGALDYPRLSRIDVSIYNSIFNMEGYPCDQFLIEVK